jgi:hypothetical protein
MTSKLSPAYVENYVNSTGDTLVRPYKKSRKRLHVKCQHCKQIYRPFWQSLKKGSRCSCQCKAKVAKALMIPFEEIKVFFEENDYKVLIEEDEYHNTSSPVPLLCPNNHIIDMTYHNFKDGVRCKFCYYESRKLTLGEFIIRSKKKHGDLYDYSLFICRGSTIKGDIICRTCSLKFPQDPCEHMRGAGCPHCKISNGEKELIRHFGDNGIPFESQKKFLDTLQRWDFYIPNSEIHIEFNGGQHYTMVDYWGGKEGFSRRVMLDLKKYLWALEAQKILFIFTEFEEYIPYAQYFICESSENNDFLFYLTNSMIYEHCERLYDYLESLPEEIDGFPYDDLDKVYIIVRRYLNKYYAEKIN